MIEYLYTLNSNDQQDSYPSATFAEAGYLRDANNWDYLVAVNRRCAPSQGSVDDRRKMKMKLKKSSGEWVVSELPSGQNWTCSYNSHLTTSLLEPGEGRVYRVAPRDINVPSAFNTISEALSASMAGQIVKVSAGSYSESGTLTVKTGVILQLGAGVTINFAAGSRLAVYGTLDINGTDTTSNAVTLTCATSTPGSWQGVWLYGASAYHELDYARIKYATCGVSAATNTEADLNNCILEQNRYGIYANNAAVYLYDSKVRNNSTAGVILYGNRPSQFGGSRISNPGVDGFQFISASPAVFNTLVTRNYRGVVGSSSTIDMGTSCDYGGWNSIFSNSSFELSVTNGLIYAQKNWWGFPGIPFSDFYYGAGGTILAWCYLSSPPPSAYLTGQEAIDKAATVGEAPVDEYGIYEVYAQALTGRADGEYGVAIELLKQIIERHPYTTWARYAIMELCRTHELVLKKGGGLIDLSNYLTTLVRTCESQGNDSLYPIAMKLLISEFFRQEDAVQAIEQCGRVLRAFPDSQWEEYALYDLFSIHLFLQQDADAAGRDLTELEQKFPQSDFLIPAYSALGKDISNLAKETELVKPVSQAAIPGEIPREYELSNNYPNPFNPDTEIQYALPEAGFVRIIIYNLLGQIVATLSEEYKPAGKYVTKWSGCNSSGIRLPAGVYLCRIKVNDFDKSIKMMLMP